jgi:hypothetical protein
MNNNRITFKHLNTDQLEGETVDAKVRDGRINFILTARKRLRSLNLNCSDTTRQDIVVISMYIISLLKMKPLSCIHLAYG